jgi:hypothetical protein
VGLLLIWLLEIDVDPQLIPTIVNGSTTASVLIVSFMGILLTVGYSNKLWESNEMRNRLYFTIVLMSAILFMIQWTFYSYLGSFFQKPLQFSLSALTVAVGTFATLTNSVLVSLVRKKN